MREGLVKSVIQNGTLIKSTKINATAQLSQQTDFIQHRNGIVGAGK